MGERTKKIVKYTTSFNCPDCLDNEGFPLEFDMEDFHTIEDKSEKIKAIPSSEYIINENDRLIIAGEIKNINVLKNLN